MCLTLHLPFHSYYALFSMLLVFIVQHFMIQYLLFILVLCSRMQPLCSRMQHLCSRMQSLCSRMPLGSPRLVQPLGSPKAAPGQPWAAPVQHLGSLWPGKPLCSRMQPLGSPSLEGRLWLQKLNFQVSGFPQSLRVGLESAVLAARGVLSKPTLRLWGLSLRVGLSSTPRAGKTVLYKPTLRLT